VPRGTIEIKKEQSVASGWGGYHAASRLMSIFSERILVHAGRHPTNQGGSHFISEAMFFFHFLLTTDVYTKVT
jgi:hypothetical protein